MTKQKTNARKVVFDSLTGHVWSQPVVTVYVLCLQAFLCRNLDLVLFISMIAVG